MLNTIALHKFWFQHMINHMKKKQIGTQCYVASLTGRFIVASDQLTAAPLFHKEVIHVNYEHHTESQSIRVTIFDLRQCTCYSNRRNKKFSPVKGAPGEMCNLHLWHTPNK